MIGRYCTWLGLSGILIGIVNSVLLHVYLSFMWPERSLSTSVADGLFILLFSVSLGFLIGLLVGWIGFWLVQPVLPSIDEPLGLERRRPWLSRLVGIGSGVLLGWSLGAALAMAGRSLIDLGPYGAWFSRQRWAASGLTFDFYNVAINVVPLVIFALGNWLAIEQVLRRANQRHRLNTYVRPSLEERQRAGP